ncbi:MAG: DUF6152 family protein [Vicinamibacterales bacterium]
MRRLWILAAVIVMLGAAGRPLAHHSFAAQFDGSKSVTLAGAITRVEWRNPHIWVFFDVKNPDGSTTSWACEGGAPNQLIRQGWSPDLLKVGESLEVLGYLARDGSKTCNGRTWKVAGRGILSGANNDGGPGGR